MSWTTVRGTIIGDGIIQTNWRVAPTLLVETEDQDRITISPHEKILNKLAIGDNIEFETKKGGTAKFTWFLGRLKRNCRNVRRIVLTEQRATNRHDGASDVVRQGRHRFRTIVIFVLICAALGIFLFSLAG